MNVKYLIAFVILICLQVVATNAKDVGVTSDCKTEGESCSSKNTVDLWQILDQIIAVLREIVKRAIGNTGSSNSSNCNNCSRRCDGIRYFVMPPPVCANIVFMDDCEFNCMKRSNPNVQRTKCPANTQSPGRSFPTSDENCVCGCEKIVYIRAPDPICASITFADRCHFDCVKNLYNNVKEVPCKPMQPK